MDNCLSRRYAVSRLFHPGIIGSLGKHGGLRELVQVIIHHFVTTDPQNACSTVRFVRGVESGPWKYRYERFVRRRRSVLEREGGKGSALLSRARVLLPSNSQHWPAIHRSYETSLCVEPERPCSAKPRHAQGIFAPLAMGTRPAPRGVTFTSQWRQGSEHIEPRTYSPDASVDQTQRAPPERPRSSSRPTRWAMNSPKR